MTKAKKYEDKEKRTLVEEWDRSGLSSADFARSRGIRPDLLQAWGRAIRGPLRRRSRTRPVSRALQIVEVGIGRPRRDPAVPRVELILNDGRRVLLFADWTPQLMAEFVKSLESRR